MKRTVDSSRVGYGVVQSFYKNSAAQDTFGAFMIGALMTHTERHIYIYTQLAYSKVQKKKKY